MRRTSIQAGFLAILAVVATYAQRNDAWRVIGPGGGGAMFYPTISPHDPNVVIESSDMTGTYLTHDAGARWRMINLRGVPRFFVFDPSDPKVIYAKTIGLWRSADGGVTWNLIHPNPKDVTGIAMPDDHADESFQTASGEAENVTALAVDPKNSSVLYAAFASKGDYSLRQSVDSGRTWKALAALPHSAGGVYIDARSSEAARRVYLAGAGGSWLFDGQALQSGAPPPETLAGVSAGFSKEGAFTIYGVGRKGVHVSRDGGRTWTSAKPAAELPAVATSLQHPEVAYLSYSAGEGNPGALGVLKTTDFGQTWKPVWEEKYNRKSPEVDDGWVSDTFGPDWGSNPLALGVAQQNPEIVYATDYGRTLRSLDGGATWKAVYTHRVPGADWTTSGLDVTTSYGVHFDPFDKNHLFISYTDIGLFASHDGGKSWASSVKGVPKPWINTTYWLVFDPAVAGRSWAVMSGTHDLPRPKMWRRSSPSSYQGGIVRSDDGGKTWTPQRNGLPETAATDVLIDPRSKPDSRVLYVAAFGRGVYRSADGGKTWELRNNGLPAHEPFAWKLAQDRNGVLYLVIARRSDDGSIGNDRDGALYRSRDEGGSWEKLSLPEGVNGPTSLIVDPQDPQRLYLSAWRRNTPAATAGGGIYLTTDGGSTWRSVLNRDQHVHELTLDAARTSVLYACGFESSAWRSEDRGEHWKRIAGYNFKWGRGVTPDAHNPKMVYITTFGGSVWYGPATGDPKAVEDIVTPVAAFPKE
jgi:photosystem II stability/assembly factor-like uncharacterized protein